MSVRPYVRTYVRPYIHNETQCSHKPKAEFVKVDETFTMIWFSSKVIRGQGQGEEMTSVPYRDYFPTYTLQTGH